MDFFNHSNTKILKLPGHRAGSEQRQGIFPALGFRRICSRSQSCKHIAEGLLFPFNLCEGRDRLHTGNTELFNVPTYSLRQFA